MTAQPPCVDDTCSVSAEADDDGHLELSVILDADGGLICTPDQGVGAKIDPSADNNLSVGAAGLLAMSQGYQIASDLGGTEVGFPADNTQTADSADLNIVNSSATRDRVIIIHAKLQMTFSVDDDTWETDGALVLNVNGSEVSETFALGGADASAGPGGTDEKVHSAHITVFETLAAGSSLNLRTYGASRTQDGNFVDTPAHFRGFLSVLVLDMPDAALFTVT